SAVKAYSRKKHLPLNSFISLDSDKLELAESTNPEDIIIASDEVSRMMGTIEKRLSPFERSIVILYLSGKSYSEIASELQISQKSVDNAMQRVHKKLKAKA
ncbi:MAG: sigma factor-like helix-turn-helix DNA-binding protein, partial [Oscillospiraceae bacterium]